MPLTEVQLSGLAPCWSSRRTDQIVSPSMDHHPKFEGFRYIGDKRTQLVYDLTTWDDDDVINDIADSGVGLGFGPDTLAEAKNRGYTLATPGKRRRHLKPRA